MLGTKGARGDNTPGGGNGEVTRALLSTRRYHQAWRGSTKCNRGLAVLQEGLSPLSEEPKHTDMVPVSYWTTGLSGAVQFLFFAEDSEKAFCPADVTFQKSRNEDGWYPIETPHFCNANRTDAIGDPNFMRLQPHKAMEASCSHLEDQPEPGRLAIVMSGFHTPEVAEIWLVQGGGIDKRPSSGHFGAWTICTELFAPLRV
jgi:hypothetical protein